MSGGEVYRGEMMQGHTPEWRPLIDVVGEELVADFMWMFEVRLSDGTALHAYKHIDTRRYLHLAQDGATFMFEAPDRYRPIHTPSDVYRHVYADEHRHRRRGHE